jgi:hypothetical protein
VDPDQAPIDVDVDGLEVPCFIHDFNYSKEFGTIFFDLTIRRTAVPRFFPVSIPSRELVPSLVEKFRKKLLGSQSRHDLVSGFPCGS